MEKQESAVNWLIDEAMKLVVQYMQGTLNEDTLDEVIYELRTKAKAMEKEQIKDAWDNGCEDDGIIDNAEQYYNQTFKSE